MRDGSNFSSAPETEKNMAEHVFSISFKITDRVSSDSVLGDWICVYLTDQEQVEFG